MPFSLHPQRITPPTPWMPLTDLQWHALAPYVTPRAQGRRVADMRARMDSIFELVVRQPYAAPWRDALAFSGSPATVARFFRRLTHKGLWHRLLSHLAGDQLSPSHPLRQIEWFICKAARRAARIGGLRLLFLVKALGLPMALTAPSWLLPDRFLSVLAWRLPLIPAHLHPCRPSGPDPRGDASAGAAGRGPSRRSRLKAWLRTLKALHRMAAGRARIPACLKRAW